MTYMRGGGIFQILAHFFSGGGGVSSGNPLPYITTGVPAAYIRPNPQDGDIKIGDFFVAALTAEKISKGG